MRICRPCAASSRPSGQRTDCCRRLQPAGGLLLLVLGAACAHAPVGGRAETAAEWILPDRATGRQYLFRVSLGGEGGSGSGRLILALATHDHFQLRTSDTLGRSLWSFELGPEGWLLVDPRARRFCRGSAAAAIPELELQALPAAALPAVLLGFLPEPPERFDAGAPTLDWRDVAGRRWTARRDGPRLVAWTLWQDDGPLLWWTRAEQGGILSHRGGLQLRWREVTNEPIRDRVPALAAPRGHRETTCDELDLPELRQDQPPPAGGGPPG